jgi:hypothetical protein
MGPRGLLASDNALHGAGAELAGYLQNATDFELMF